MPALKHAPVQITARHLADGLKTYAKVTLPPEAMSACSNVRANKDGGRFPRPGVEDSQIDYSAYSFIAGRGQISGKSPKKLWLAGDNGTNVKITYVDTDLESAQYGVVFDVGLTLTTGKYVQMLEWLGDIYFANGVTVGAVVVGRVATGGVSAGASELNLRPGNGVKFPATGSGLIGTDSFSWTGRTADQLTGVTGLAEDHDAEEVVTHTLTLSPLYCDKATVIEEWLASLNLGGDPESPFVWEFSKFAFASAPENFRDFSGAPANTELVGQGGEIRAFLKTNNFFYVWKEDSLHGTSRSAVDTDTGARVPQPVDGVQGTPNARTVAKVVDDELVYLATNKRIPEVGTQIVDGSTKSAPRSTFDSDIEKLITQIDDLGQQEWVHYNSSEKLLKVRVFESGVSVVYVKDYNVGEWFRDTNKNFDCICQHGDKSWAFDGSAGKMYIDEIGNFDDTVPVESDWATGRMGRGEFELGKAIYLRMHGYMTLGSIAFVDFYKEDRFQFTKMLTDAYVQSTDPSDGVNVGSGGVGNGNSIGSGGGVSKAFPFRFPVGANHKGEDFSIRVRMPGENGDFVQFDGFTIGVRPLRRYPSKHA